MSKKIGLVSVAALVFVVVLVAFAGTALAAYDTVNHVADKSAVVGSPHDVGSDNPCTSCHIPHDANGEFLWARPYSTLNTGASNVTTNDDLGISTIIKPMCYSCHDGTITDEGLVTSFSASHTNHRTRAATALRTSGSNAGTPYGPGRDCDLCHDPHDDGNSNFLKYERSRTSNGVTTWTPITAGGNVCASCHSGNVDGASDGSGGTMINHPTNVVPSASSKPVDTLWSPTTGAYWATRLWNPTTPRYVSSASDAVVMCQSCHSPHGAEPAATYDSGTIHGLNTYPTANGELCLNCHGPK